jgi:hypothetical protein
VFNHMSKKAARIALALGVAVMGTATIVAVAVTNADASAQITIPQKNEAPLPPPPPWWGSGGNVAGSVTSHPAMLPMSGPDGQLLHNPDGSVKMVPWLDTPPIPGR